jgi:hypothetical protein
VIANPARANSKRIFIVLRNLDRIVRGNQVAIGCSVGLQKKRGHKRGQSTNFDTTS